MRILQYINAIVDLVGGAERVFCEMANTFVARGHEVYAVCNDINSGYPFYSLDNRVHFVNLDGSGHRSRRHKPLIWKITRPFRFAAKETWDRYIGEPFDNLKSEPLANFIREVQPDIVVTNFVDDYFSVYRQPMLDVPVILMHHSDDNLFVRCLNTRKKIKKINTCHHLQVLQHCFVSGIQKLYRGPIHVIPNVVPQIDENEMAVLTREKLQKKITMISRLNSGKQQHILIEAFGRLSKNYPDWKVEIYGPPGSQEYLQQLKSTIVSLGLVDQVELMGTTDMPLDILRNADIFAFPSLFEGFPLALTEAMAVGLPCVGLKTTPSVNELIMDGINGFLADNTPEDFAAKLKILMDDHNLRAKMGWEGHEMMKQYAPEIIWDRWENLITEVVHQHRQRRAA